ncbi:hypothetical protein QQF64_003349, partial [Cirrhinus molitorella]
MVLLGSVGLLALLVSVQCLNRRQLFDYGIQFGDKILESGTDSVEELALEQTLFFFKGKFNKVYNLQCVKYNVLSATVLYKAAQTT